MRRKHVNDTIDALKGGICVQRREDEVARFGNRQGGFDSLEISHFSDEHDIGILPQNVFQGLFKSACVSAHFSLIDDAALMRV